MINNKGSAIAKYAEGDTLPPEPTTSKCAQSHIPLVQSPNSETGRNNQLYTAGLNEYNPMQGIARNTTKGTTACDDLDRIHISWNWSVFTTFLVYHILYQALLGPFVIILLWKQPGITMLRNMRMLPAHNPYFYLQTIIWLGSLGGGFSYFIEDESVIQLSEILLMWFAILLKCVVIAAKYATLGNARLALYATQIQHYILIDLMNGDWLYQTPRILFIEQHRALQRHQYSVYGFDFISTPSNKVVLGITTTEVRFPTDWIMRQQIEQTRPQFDQQTFNGFHIFAYFVKQFTKGNSHFRLRIMALLVATILAITPAIFKFVPDDLIDILRMLIILITCLFTYYGVLLTLFIGLYDLQRQSYLVEQCTLLINMRDNELPMININNPMTLNSLAMMRSVALDYGQTYTKRTQGVMQIIMVLVLAVIIYSWLHIGNVSQLELLSGIQLIEISGILLLMTLVYLYRGAKLNSYCYEYTRSLHNIKSIYIDILRLREHFFRNIQQSTTFQLKVQPICIMHKMCLNLLKEQVGNQEEALKKHIHQVISEIDNNLRLQQSDAQYHSFQVFGISITYNLLKCIIAIVLIIYGYLGYWKIYNC